MTVPARRVGLVRRARLRRASPRTAGVRARDRAWSALVRGGAGGRCERCGRAGVDAHHVLGKGAFPHLRHDPDNGVALCRADHRLAHDRNKEFLAWFQHAHPERWARLDAAKGGGA